MTTVRRLLWDGIDPQRVDTATVTVEGRSLTARGSSVADTHALVYDVVTGTDYVTASLLVTAQVDGERHVLDLRRAHDGAWTSEHDGGPPERLDLDGVLDCDLGQCLLTNAMPMLRHDLVTIAAAGGGDPVDFVMALVDVPALSVTRSGQRYTPLRPTGRRGTVLVRFESDDFAADLEVDDDGFVVDYPGLGRRR